MVQKPPQKLRRAHGRVAVSVLLLLSLTELACGATSPEQAAASRQAIAGGTADSTHQNVFLLASHVQDSGGLCTATLIAQNLLLTARHCVSPGREDDHVLCGDSVLGEPYPASAFIATNDARPRQSSPIFKAAAVRVPGEGVDTCGYDIALLILSENVPSRISSPAVPRIDREVSPGESYTAVGYGENAEGESNGSRMVLRDLSVACAPGSCGDGVESTEFRGETGICSGDSGGPAFDEQGKVVGVVSRGGPDCSTPIYGTVTAWRDFLVQTATEAATLGGYEPSFWVTTRSSEPPLSGAAGAPSAAEGATEGEPCQSGSSCASPLVCYQSAPGAESTCAATCSATADCRSGQVCESAGSVSVCASPPKSAEDTGGCSFGPPPPCRSLGLLLALPLAGLALQRRRWLLRARP